MARKNLSRTAIEGGRHDSNKWERRKSSRYERVNAKQEIAAAQLDVEALTDVTFEKRDKVRKEFSDKLNPVYRYLDSQVGRPWDKVRSEIVEKFDSRTTAGRHILFDHIISNVKNEGEVERSFSRTDWVVDKHGILRIGANSWRHGKRRRYTRDTLPDYEKNRVINWLNHRRVGVVGNKMFWFALVGKPHKWGTREYSFSYRGSARGLVTRWGTPQIGWQGKPYISDPNVIRYCVEVVRTHDYYGNPLPEPKTEHHDIANANYRQDVEFSRADRKYFDSLPEWVRKMLLKYSPVA